MLQRFEIISLKTSTNKKHEFVVCSRANSLFSGGWAKGSHVVPHNLKNRTHHLGTHTLPWRKPRELGAVSSVNQNTGETTGDDFHRIHAVQIGSFPRRGMNIKKYFKPPPSILLMVQKILLPQLRLVVLSYYLRGFLAPSETIMASQLWEFCCWCKPLVIKILRFPDGNLAQHTNTDSIPIERWSPKKKRGPLSSIESWLFNRDPCNGLL